MFAQPSLETQRVPQPARPYATRPPLQPLAGRAAAPRPPLDSAHPVSLLVPPYERTQPLRTLSDEIARVTPGALLMVELETEPADWGSLQELTQRLRATAPLLPIALRVDPHRVDVLHAAVHVARMPVRAIVAREEPCAQALRRQLTRPADLATDVVDWLGLRGTRLTPTLRHLIHGIFALAPESSSVAPLLARIGTSESSARFRLQKKRMPAPGRWLQVARALHAALHLQSRPERPLLRIALTLGYSDHSALSHLLGRAFGVRPAEIRHRLGWEWLLDRWLRSRALRLHGE